MKYILLLLVLVICAAAYIRTKQPLTWNAYLDDLKSPPVSPTGDPIVEGTNAPPLSIAAQPAKLPPVSTNTPTAEIAPSSMPTGFLPSTSDSNKNVVLTPKDFVPPDPIPAQPNWTWSILGKDYHNVVVTKVEADCVHIMYDGGIGSINMTDLTPELQKMFNYDPALAAQEAQEKAAAAAKIDAEQAPLIAAEKQKEQAQAAEDEAQRQKSIRDENASIAAGAARDQIQHIQSDMQDMIAHHEVWVSTNQQTGVTTYGGNTYWLNKFYADQSAIAQLSQTANLAGNK